MFEFWEVWFCSIGFVGFGFDCVSLSFFFIVLCCVVFCFVMSYLALFRFVLSGPVLFCFC